MEPPTLFPTGRPKKTPRTPGRRRTPSRGVAPRERRGALRYRLKLALKYRICTERTSQIGFGETCDISGRALRFTSDAPVTARASKATAIELSIDWPAKMDDSPLCLTVIGTILRSDARGIVVLIRRYDLGPAAAFPV